MSSLAVLLQESAAGSLGCRLTILGLLKERMDMDGAGPDSRIRRRKSFRERMGLKGMGMGGCCGGPIWGLQATTISVHDDDEDDNDRVQIGGGEVEGDSEIPQQQEPDATPRSGSGQACAAGSPPDASASMNLAAALAAERHHRAAQEPAEAAGGGGADQLMGQGAAPLRVSLMRLLEEAEAEGEAAAAGSDSVCCVCMGRKKGAAFIPCGHTYCRVCSRELWLNRGSCPLCNRPILEILDIF